MSDDMLPPEGGLNPNVPQVPPPPSASPGPKQPLDPAFVALGFFTPWLASILAGFLANALSMLDLPAFVLTAIGALVPLIAVVGIVVAFIRGRATGDKRLRSFGLGGLISIAATTLLSLLAFGACFLTGAFGG